MQYRVLGRTGLHVSALGLGGGNFGQLGRLTAAECIRIAHCAFDGGINLIVTADSYSFGESEEIVGKAVAGRRDKVILASKVGNLISDDVNERGASRRWIMQAVERSLKRLDTDYLDLYSLHQPDGTTDIEESLQALNDLVSAGKIRYFGTSNFSAAQLTEAALRAKMSALSGPHSEESQLSILSRAAEAELLPVCEKYGIGFLAYAPLNGGWLSGAIRQDRRPGPNWRDRLMPSYFDLSVPDNRLRVEAVEKLAVLAADADLELVHLAVGFLLTHRGVTTALLGADTVEQMQKYLESQDAELSDELLDRIDGVVAPGATVGAPHQLPTPSLLDSALRRCPRSKPQTSGSNSLLRHLRELLATEKQTPSK